MSRVPRPPMTGRTVRMAGFGASASTSRRSIINRSGSAPGAASGVIPVDPLPDGRSCPKGAGGGVFGGSWPAGAATGTVRGVVPVGASAGGVPCPEGDGSLLTGAGRGCIPGGSEPVRGCMSVASSESMAGVSVSDEDGGVDTLPAWFQGEASAALGQDWLTSQISPPSVIIGEGTSQRTQRSVLPPVQITSARARGGRRNVSTSRTSTRTAPAAVDLNDAREVHVWYLLPDEVNDASQLKVYMDLLSPSERKTALSMGGEKLQKGAVLSRALVRTTLSRYCKVDPRSFEFKKNKFGKPEILWQSDANRMEWPLHFNISHTSSLIACGITMDTPIGIDIEEKKRKTAKNILSLARRYFTPSEVDYLAKILNPDAQQKEFIKIWTLKEAYVKALGRGFSGAPFNKFSVISAAENRIQISVAPVFKDSDSSCDCLSENWRFTLAELNSSHYMAICTEDDSRNSDSGNSGIPLGLKVWKTIPFLEDVLVSGTEAVKLIS